MNAILDEVVDRHGEYLDMAGEDSPALIMSILCQMVQKERDEVKYLKSRLYHDARSK